MAADRIARIFLEYECKLTIMLTCTLQKIEGMKYKVIQFLGTPSVGCLTGDCMLHEKCNSLLLLPSDLMI